MLSKCKFITRRTNGRNVNDSDDAVFSANKKHLEKNKLLFLILMIDDNEDVNRKHRTMTKLGGS